MKEIDSSFTWEKFLLLKIDLSADNPLQSDNYHHPYGFLPFLLFQIRALSERALWLPTYGSPRTVTLRSPVTSYWKLILRVQDLERNFHDLPREYGAIQGDRSNCQPSVWPSVWRTSYNSAYCSILVNINVCRYPSGKVSCQITACVQLGRVRTGPAVE